MNRAHRRVRKLLSLKLGYKLNPFSAKLFAKYLLRVTRSMWPNDAETRRVSSVRGCGSAISNDSSTTTRFNAEERRGCPSACVLGSERLLACWRELTGFRAKRRRPFFKVARPFSFRWSDGTRDDR